MRMPPSRRRALACASALALAAGFHAVPAAAQVSAFQGNPNVASGIAVIDNIGGTDAAPRTNITILTQAAVINWTPTDDVSNIPDPINFHPANGQAIFQSEGNDFTVLNRIVPVDTGRAIRLDGDVLGITSAFSTPQVGGNIWFYSPGGIIAGAGSTFNVGSLILTANDMPYTPGQFGPVFGDGTNLQFRAAPGSTAAVVVEGAGGGLPAPQIITNGPGRYVALVAPRVVQAGNIRSDGSVAMIAAEEVDVRINGGLFDINFITGTTAPDAIVHSGQSGIGDVAPTGPARVYLAALAKNDAITMLVGGTLGNVAADAAVVNGAVVLSGGYDIFDASGVPFAPNPDNTNTVDLNIGSSQFAYNTDSHVTGTVTASPARAGTLRFAGSATLFGDQGVAVRADLTERIVVGGSLTLRSPVSAGLTAATTNPEPGDVDSFAFVNIAGDLTITASNTGLFSGQIGGAAQGGAAALTLEAGAIGPLVNIGGDLTVEANGQGGFGLEGGGEGRGGTAQLVAGSGRLQISGNSQVSALGLGGNAGVGESGTAGSGGNGFGGTALVSGSGGALIVAGADIAVNADAVGGSAFPEGPAYLDGGDGGNATGGTATLALTSASLGPIDIASPINLQATAIGSGGAGLQGGGAGGDGGAGGNGTGGTASVNVQGGSYSLLAATIDASGLGGNAAFGGAAGDTDGIGGTGTGGTARFANADSPAPIDGARRVETLQLQANGSGGATGDATTGQGVAGRAELIDTAAAAGTASFGTVTADSTGGAAPGAGVLIQSSGGVLGIDTGLTVNTGGDATFQIANSGTVNAQGTVVVNADGNISIDHSEQATPAIPSLTGGSVSLTAGGNITGSNAAYLTAATSIDATAGGAITIGRLTSGGTIALDAGGAVAVTTDIQAPGTITATGTSVTLNTIGALAVTNAQASAGDLAITSGGALSLAAGSATGDVTLTSTGGGVATGTAQAGDALGITATGGVAINGTASGATVSVRSGDIAISGEGRIQATGAITLTNGNAARRTFIGGGNNDTGYSLSADEIGRLSGQSIAIVAPRVEGPNDPARPADVTLGAFTASAAAGGQIAAGGTFSIQTPGKVRVVGAVGVTGAGDATTLAIDADEAIEIDTATGSLGLAGGNAPAGILDLASARIAAGSAAVLTNLATATDIVAIDALLAANDGAVSDNGSLSAGTLRFAVSNGLYVQNSGAGTDFGQRRGVTAGTGGIVITTADPTARIVLNGRSGAVTGIDVIPAARINGQPGGPGATGFDQRSTINGCVILSVGTCGVVPEPEVDFDPPSSDLIESPLDPEDADTPGNSDFPAPRIDIKELEPLGYQPLIDEPVTGAGNDDLWVEECDSDKDANCPR